MRRQYNDGYHQKRHLGKRKSHLQAPLSPRATHCHGYIENMRTTISTWLEENARFTTLSSMVKFTGLYDRLNGRHGLTLFALPNEVFELLPAGAYSALINKDKQLLKRDIENHIVPWVCRWRHFVDGANMKTLGGNILNVRIYDETVTINNIKISQLNTRVRNGVIHISMMALSDVGVALGVADRMDFR